MLPRPLLDWAEIHAVPEAIPDSAVEASLVFWSTRRVALVKQTAYHALYLLPGKRDWKKTVLSSLCHLGPFSFLAEMKANYFIVRQSREPETFLWKEKQAYDPDPTDSFEKKIREIEALESSPAGCQLPSVDDIPWADYDLVVAVDVPIPERIVRKCPRTLWAYYSIEAGGPLQKNSLLAPAAGYNLFLNHGFRRYRARPRNRVHVLEFPLQFQSARAWDDLRKACGAQIHRSCILVEKNSWADVPPASRAPLVCPSGEALEYLQKLLSAFVCLHTTSKPRWGNWAVEAVLSGALFLGNAGSLAQIAALVPGTNCRSLDQGVALANHLIENPSWARDIQKLQAEIVDQVAFRRPLLDLTQKAKEFFR